MNKEDFVFDHKEGSFEDYWFRVTGKTKEELTRKYTAPNMTEVGEVMISKRDGLVGIKRLYPIAYDVIATDDPQLKSILLFLAKELVKEGI